jgi:CBS domain-containing protein
MTSLTTFYLSRVLGKRVFDDSGKVIGVVADLLVDTVLINHNESTDRPILSGVKLKIGKEYRVFSFEHFTISKIKRKLRISCSKLVDLPNDKVINGLLLANSVLDKQIVDLNGRKLVRVNDVRLVTVSFGTYTIAVDVGIEGLLRRIGIVKPIRAMLSLFNLSVPAKFILWDDVQAIDLSNLNIKLSKSYLKLNTLHPSDLADIIEDLGRQSRTTVFSALDEEKAADVLEELETHAQIHIVESLPVDKVADVFEKMPADEVADILDELEDDKAEILLKEMEAESSQEVRELLEYPDNSVGSLMITEILSFNQNRTVEEVINELRIKKPEEAELYNLFVTDNKEKLIATFTLRDLVISQPYTPLSRVMKTEPICLYDDQEVDDIAEIISKYNLLAVPVIDRSNLLQGMVVVDDVIEDLIKKRRTNKR